MDVQVKDLIKKSDILKSEADNIVSESGVVRTLEKIGKVDFVGSYALNLLYRSDIDIFVTSRNCSKEVAIATTKEFLDNGLFQTVGFANRTDYQPPNGLPGYYWELIVVRGERKWKFDVWYTAEEKIKTIENTRKILEKLRNDSYARGEILKLKDKLFDGTKYKENMNGFKIYEKVLGKV